MPIPVAQIFAPPPPETARVLLDKLRGAAARTLHVPEDTVSSDMLRTYLVELWGMELAFRDAAPDHPMHAYLARVRDGFCHHDPPWPVVRVADDATATGGTGT